MSIQVAIIQTNPRIGKKGDNVEQALSLMNDVRADVYVLPELATEGYNFDSIDQVSAASDLAGEGVSFHAFSNFAHQKKAHVVFGFVERSAANQFFNSAALLGPNGMVGVYRKTHLFGRESLFFKPGDTGFQVFDLPFGRLGVMVCFDWFFPESARSLALQGAQLIVHPSNLVLPHCPQAMITRCLENRVFAATANRVGTEVGQEKTLTFIGQSQITSPTGDVLVRASSDGVESVVSSIDLNMADVKNVTPQNHLFADRRPEFYNALSKPFPGNKLRKT